jgi:hypothetical protein
MTMADREKVIKGLESLHKRLLDLAMQDSIFMLDASMVTNAIDMLKEQDPEEPIRMHHTEHKQTDNYRCRKCGNDLYFEQRFCEACGCEVKWDG